MGIPPGYGKARDPEATSKFFSDEFCERAIRRLDTFFEKRENVAGTARSYVLAKIANRANYALKRSGLNSLVEAAKKLGLRKLIYGANKTIQIEQDDILEIGRALQPVETWYVSLPASAMIARRSDSGEVVFEPVSIETGTSASA